MVEQDFVTTVQDLRPALLRVARRRCGRDHAEDAVQKAVLQQWRSGKWRQASPAQLAAWLRRETAFTALKELRGLGRFRAAQRNFRVLGDKGHRRANPTPYRSQNDDEEIER